MRVVIVDDDSAFRDALRGLLAARPEVTIVGEADDGEAGLQLVAEQQPDVIVTDLAMPRINGAEVARRAKADWPGIVVVIVTVHDEEAYRHTSEAAGADAFLLKKRLGVDLWPTLLRLCPRGAGES